MMLNITNYSATAQSIQILIVGRLLAGIGIGVTSAVVPLYISEISPTEIHGGAFLVAKSLVPTTALFSIAESPIVQEALAVTKHLSVTKNTAVTKHLLHRCHQTALSVAKKDFWITIDAKFISRHLTSNHFSGNLPAIFAKLTKLNHVLEQLVKLMLLVSRNPDHVIELVGEFQFQRLMLNCKLILMILAHLANCKSMLEAFEAGGDFHSRTTMNMYPYIRNAVNEKHVLLVKTNPQFHS
ncbi:uncharacterized protein [Arachis hypogaea]|uniref:uncharacterized protein n=1 Tax=Arachis hypogaea TaxID=3818 RepID=UPI000DEC2CE4|nr:uncharacterized protein LOC112750244 isoform X1 [Arachis hypogaea]